MCELRAFIHLIDRKSGRCHANLRRSDRAGLLQGLARAGPRVSAVVFLHGFGEYSGPCHGLGNALNGAGIDCGRDKIDHGLTKATSGFGRASFEFAKISRLNSCLAAGRRRCPLLTHVRFIQDPASLAHRSLSAAHRPENEEPDHEAAHPCHHPCGS